MDEAKDFLSALIRLKLLLLLLFSYSLGQLAVTRAVDVGEPLVSANSHDAALMASE